MNINLNQNMRSPIHGHLTWCLILKHAGRGCKAAFSISCQAPLVAARGVREGLWSDSE